MNKTIDQLIDELIEREGGYVNDPNDNGGETKYGITKAVALGAGYRGPMADLPREVAAQIYTAEYWIRPGFDRVAEISGPVAAELFDTGVNMGPAMAVSFLQRALNVLTDRTLLFDGRIGPATIEALKEYRTKRGLQGMGILTTALNVLQGEHYITLAEHNRRDKDFIYGWLANRVAL